MADRSLPARALNGVGLALIGAVTLLDMVTGPVVRPLAQAISRSSPLEFIRRVARRLPAYLALLCLVLPLAVAEPAKIFALVLIGDGRYMLGIGTLVAAYLVSLLLVDTIYDGARPQLRSIGWFAIAVDYVAAIRSAVFAKIRQSRAYRIVRDRMQRVRAWFARRRSKPAR